MMVDKVMADGPVSSEIKWLKDPDEILGWQMKVKLNQWAANPSLCDRRGVQSNNATYTDSGKLITTLAESYTRSQVQKIPMPSFLCL